MRALSDSSEEVPHGPRCQAYRPDRRPLGTHSPALHFRAIGLPTAFAMPEAWRAICLRKREARPSADAEGAENGERLRRRRRREDDRGLRALRGAHGREGDVRPCEADAERVRERHGRDARSRGGRRCPREARRMGEARHGRVSGDRGLCRHQGDHRGEAQGARRRLGVVRRARHG